VSNENGMRALFPDARDRKAVETAITEDMKARRKLPTSPIHLTASTTLASNSSGGVNAISLRNPLNQPMEILETKWRLDIAKDVGNLLGGLVGCKLDLGKYPITNGFVPVWSFGRSENLSEERIPSPGIVGPAGTLTMAFEYTWRLPMPLYVPIGAALIPTFQHRGMLADSVDVRISYSGRTLPLDTPPPKKIVLPYVAAFSSKVIDAQTSTFDQSVETDLVNSFSQPIHLQGFSGRGLVIRNDNLAVSAESLSNGEAMISNALSVRMVDSNGRPIVRNFTRFRTAFAAATRFWGMENGATMDPRSFYLAFLRFTPLAVPPIVPVTLQAFIALTGWRDLSEGGVA